MSVAKLWHLTDWEKNSPGVHRFSRDSQLVKRTTGNTLWMDQPRNFNFPSNFFLKLYQYFYCEYPVLNSKDYIIRMWVGSILRKQTKFIHICLMYLFIDNEVIIRGGIKLALNKDVLPLPDSITVLSIFFPSLNRSRSIWSKFDLSLLQLDWFFGFGRY